MRTRLLGALSVITIILVVLSGVRFSLANPKSATANDPRRLEAEFMKAAAEKGADAYMSYYAEDAVEVPNGAPAIHGKANITKTMVFLNDKSNRLTWTPVYADISSSGHMGHTSGSQQASGTPLSNVE
jgi:ketosteroid isomerase-like protein